MFTTKDKKKLAEILHTDPDKLTIKAGDSENGDDYGDEAVTFYKNCVPQTRTRRTFDWTTQKNITITEPDPDPHGQFVGEVPYHQSSCCGLAELTSAQSLLYAAWDDTGFPATARKLALLAALDAIKKEGFGGVYATTIQTQPGAASALRAAGFKQVNKFKSGKTGNTITLHFYNLKQRGRVR